MMDTPACTTSSSLSIQDGFICLSPSMFLDGTISNITPMNSTDEATTTSFPPTKDTMDLGTSSHTSSDDCAITGFTSQPLVTGLNPLPASESTHSHSTNVTSSTSPHSSSPTSNPCIFSESFETPKKNESKIPTSPTSRYTSIRFGFPHFEIPGLITKTPYSVMIDLDKVELHFPHFNFLLFTKPSCKVTLSHTSIFIADHHQCHFTTPRIFAVLPTTLLHFLTDP